MCGIMDKIAAAEMSLLVLMSDGIGQNAKKDYIRIEHEAGGATHLAMSECDLDAIDKVADELIAHIC